MVVGIHETIDNAPVGLWKLDRQFVIVRANRQASAQSGMPSEYLLGRSIFEVLPSLSQEMLDKALNQGEAFDIDSCRIWLEDGFGGREAYWDIAVGPVVDEQGAIAGLVLACVDITERVHLRQQRDDFVAILTHNLKTPIIGMNRTLELLLDGVLGEMPPAQQQVISLLARNNQGLLRMVQNLLEVYRYESSIEALNFQRIDLLSTLYACVAEVAPLAKNRNLQVKCDLPDKLPAAVADQVAVHHLFINLLENAIKYTQPGGVIEVGASSTECGVEVTVKDSGIGISIEHQSKLFKRSWHGGGERQFTTGSGLGLYLCRQIVTAHGGEISCQSEVDVGTVITVKFNRIVSSDGGITDGAPVPAID